MVEKYFELPTLAGLEYVPFTHDTPPFLEETWWEEGYVGSAVENARRESYPNWNND